MLRAKPFKPPRPFTTLRCLEALKSSLEERVARMRESLVLRNLTTFAIYYMSGEGPD
jgi:hypothetical protein